MPDPHQDPKPNPPLDIAWITKPTRTGTIGSRPAQSGFKTGRQANLLDHSVAGPGWTPIPAQQVDPSTTGWLVAQPILPSPESTGVIDLCKASERATVLTAR